MSKMKKSVTNQHSRIAQLIAQKISDDTAGVEYTAGEVEIEYKTRLYRVEYELRREFNTVYYDYDTEPDNRSKTYLSIIGGAVYDSEGNEVTSDFDFTAVEEYFDFTDSFEFE